MPFVRGYAVVGQTLYVLFLLTLWFALLRHRRQLIDSLPRGASFLDFFKAACGGAELTWRQVLFPLRMAELPWAYQLFWPLAILLLAGSADRWYLGLEWWGVVEGRRAAVGVAAMSLGFLAYFWWLWSATRIGPTPHSANTGLPAS